MRVLLANQNRGKIEGVRVIGGPLNRGFTVVTLIYAFKNDLPDQ